MFTRTIFSYRPALGVLLAALLLLPGTASAQTAELRGSVVDASGSALPGVTVTITNTATGVERVVVTDEQGVFRVPALQPGPYAVESSLTGFGSDTKQVVLTVGQVADLRVALGVGAISETVQVVGRSAVVIETTKSDLSAVVNQEQLSELPNLLQILATRSATLLNFAELSRSSGLTQTTLKRYFSLLETLFLVVRIPAWAHNPGKRLVKAPKVFLPDSGMLAWLSDMSPDKLQTLPGLPGALVETYVATELLKHLAFSQRGLSLWHYRTQADTEVDFVLEDRQGRITGIEVKAGASVDGSSFKGLRHLQDTESERFQRGIVFYGGRDLVAFSPQLLAVPLSWWWASS